MTQIFSSVNPATGSVIGEYAALDDDQIDSVLRKAQLAYVRWRVRPIAERAQLLRQLAHQLRQTAGESARLMTEEMGKPIAQSQAEIEKCARLCDYYSASGPEFLAPQQVAGNAAARSYIRFDPLGAVLAVMPWNFPFWQVFRFAAPALLAGNVGLLKHATNVLGCAAMIERLFREAGFPPGVFASLAVGPERVPALLQHECVKAATLTGSESAGRAVAAEAGRQLKKVVLELGGADPFLVRADAALDFAAAQAAEARTINNGQSCIAAKRFIVVGEAYKPFVEQFVERMRALRMGDPIQEGVQIGPLARKDLRESLHEQVAASLRAGARLCTGGAVPDGPGWFYPPTVLAEVAPGMPAFDEELFGPVAAVIRAADDAEAVALANRSRFGLGASIWTGDIDAAERMATEIESGCVFINEYTKSDPTLPFGGVKCSGFGRELGEFGIREFVNVKAVWVSRN